MTLPEDLLWLMELMGLMHGAGAKCWAMPLGAELNLGIVVQDSKGYSLQFPWMSPTCSSDSGLMHASSL